MKRTELPVPHFEIGADYRIRNASMEAAAAFPPAEDWRELVDGGSLAKADRFVTPAHSGMRVELNLRTAEQPAALFDVYQRWDEASGTGQLVCICRQSGFDAGAGQLRALRERLERGGTDFVLGPGLVRGGGTAAPASRSGAQGEVRTALETIRELVGVVKPGLVELHKAEYADLILAQVDAALEGLDGERRG
ncbi:hypothetical protein SAMN02799624_04460 [Paenibacillus sp. UNC496MF]|uniref:hypothetical protein n=1 Tax=Paenibacillus sp. UNC496MF TaxID=1502753 RepID=UPI0008E677A6|nr:hypothetical protein [Paenibacillus sp. UNC496MF]SFJ42915.1 hypothetical protein SAMN02799624_04460 [Paenibacillus sp. UNC496MF]